MMSGNEVFRGGKRKGRGSGEGNVEYLEGGREGRGVGRGMSSISVSV